MDWVLREIWHWVEEHKEHPHKPPSRALKGPQGGVSVVQAIFHEIISLLTFKNCNFIQNENY